MYQDDMLNNSKKKSPHGGNEGNELSDNLRIPQIIHEGNSLIARFIKNCCSKFF